MNLLMKTKTQYISLFLIVTICIVFCFPATVSAAKYPSKMIPHYYDDFDDYGVKLTKDYSFSCIWQDDGNSYNYIIGKHSVVVKHFKHDGYMEFAGKYDGRYYFIALRGSKALGIYTWKPGKFKFTKIKSGICIHHFNKKYAIPFHLISGAKIGNYATAGKTWPTEPGPRPKIYIYNLNTNKYKTLDKTVFGIKRFGKKIYYVKGIKKNSTEMKKLVIKKCAADGNNKKNIKMININDNGELVYSAMLSKHYVEIRTEKGKRKVRFR